MQILENIQSFFGRRTYEATMSASEEAAAASLAARKMALYIASSYITKALSKCEFKTYEKGIPVKKELYYALNVSPNPNQSGSHFVNAMVDRMIYDGHSIMVQPSKSRNRFYIADSFSPEPRPLEENLFAGVSVEGRQLGVKLKASDVCYFRLEDKEPRAVVADMYADMGQLLGMTMASCKNANGERFTLEREGRPGGQREDVKQDANEVNDLLRGFIRSPYGVMPLSKNQILKRVEPNGSGSVKDVIDLRRDIFEITANAFQIPQSMMYGNMTNTNDVMNQFITCAIDPIADMIGKEITRKFYGFHSWDGGRTRVHVDTTKINHVDIFQVAEKAEKLVSSGLFSIDDTLDAMGADKLNTEFSQAHWITKNYSLIQDALNQLAAANAEGGENDNANE